MEIVSTSPLGDKHVSWLVGFGCLAWGQHAPGVGGWDHPARSGDLGSHPHSAIGCPRHLGESQIL